MGLLADESPANPLPGGDDERAADGIFFFRRPVGKADGGQPASDGGQLVPPLDEFVQVEGRPPRARPTGGEAVRAAPGAEIGDVMSVGAAGGGCPAGIDMGYFCPSPRKVPSLLTARGPRNVRRRRACSGRCAWGRDGRGNPGLSASRSRGWPARIRTSGAACADAPAATRRERRPPR